jgi:hypothetical protein
MSDTCWFLFLTLTYHIQIIYLLKLILVLTCHSRVPCSYCIKKFEIHSMKFPVPCSGHCYPYVVNVSLIDIYVHQHENLHIVYNSFQILVISNYDYQNLFIGTLDKKSSCICSDLYKFAEVVFLQLWLQGFVIVSVLFDTTYCPHTP